MAFHIDEVIWLLKKSNPAYSDEEIADIAVKCVRSITDYKNGKSAPKPKQDGVMQEKLSPVLVKACDLPWSLAAHYQVNSIRALDQSASPNLEKLHGFSAQQFAQRLEQIDPKEIRSGQFPISSEMWGMAIVAFFFLRSVWTHADERKQSEISPQWNHVVAVLTAMLSQEAEAPWATVLGFKVASGEFAIIWNGLDPKSEERSSKEIKDKVQELDIYNAFIAYNDIVPTAKEAPWSATCIASRFKEREKYQDLFSRLGKAESSFLTEDGILKLKEVDRDLDEDFDDFLEWISENQATLFKRGVA